MVIAQVMQKVMSVWCMLEDLWCKENDRKVKIGGHRRVSDEQPHHRVSFHSSSICRSLVSHCETMLSAVGTFVCMGTAVDVSLTAEVCVAVTHCL